jgi:EmrB/QacA subfamily drug resistance transporter
MAQPFVEPCDAGVIAAEPCPRALKREIAPQQRRLVLAACVLASSMAFVDGSALTVALPKLRAGLGADLASVQWVLNGYVLALAAFTLIGGALADVYGKARMLVIGCAAFDLALAACAFAPSIAWLIALRVVQGIAAAIVTPASLALIGATYPKAERSAAIGIWAAASALTTAGGPVLGGWLTESFGWRYVFGINPPLALAAIVLLAMHAHGDARERRRFDLGGAAILALALAPIAWALSQIGPSRAGSANDLVTFGAGALGLAALAGYAAWERASAEPMTPPRLIANRPFVGLNVATLLIYGGVAIMFFVLSFDLIDRRALAPTQAGLVFLPFTLGVGLLSRAFGAVADKIGARAMLIVGPLAAAASFLWLALGHDAALAPGVLAPLGLLGLAFAILVAPLTSAVLSSVTDADEGLASGINNAMSRRQRRSADAAPERGNRNERGLPAHPRYPQGEAERARLRGVPEDRFAMGAFAPVPHLWARRLLRFIAQQACHQALSRHRPPDHGRLRSAGRLGLVPCGRNLRRSAQPHATARADPTFRIMRNAGSRAAGVRSFFGRCLTRRLRRPCDGGRRAAPSRSAAISESAAARKSA